MMKGVVDGKYIPGKYKVVNPEKIVEYFDMIKFTMSNDELLLLTNEYEINEMGYLFVDSNWVKTCVYNSIWLDNSKRLNSYFVKWYVEKTYPYSDCENMYKHIECLFTKYNIPFDINRTAYHRNLGRLRKYKQQKMKRKVKTE